MGTPLQHGHVVATRQQIGIAQTPRQSVSRGVEFRHNSDTPLPGVLLHFCHERLVVDHQRWVERTLLAVNTQQKQLSRRDESLLPQLWKSGAHVGETVLVDDVPPKDVKLVVGHGVQELQDQLLGLVMSRGVQHQAPIRKSRIVVDGSGPDSMLCQC
jgi:hypothetical protein